MRTLPSRLLVVLVSLLAFACSSEPPHPPTGGSADGGESGGIAGLELFSRLAGLWSGPATDTRLGGFPLKNMDLRPAGDSVLFGRVDLDEQNSLRFAFSVELHAGAPVLVFRNGGLFQGLSRDTRTKLVETDGTSYRFCAIDGGCGYADAEFRFLGEDSLELRVLVRGTLHERWTPRRVETRALPLHFPARTELPGDGDFPPMPSAQLRVKWSSPLPAPADVWAILSTTACIPSGTCQFSRWIKTRADAGSTEAGIRLEQLHPGTYSLLGVVDANDNLKTIRFPDSGDLLSVPSPTLEVGPQGLTQSDVTASYRFP